MYKAIILSDAMPESLDAFFPAEMMQQLQALVDVTLPYVSSAMLLENPQQYQETQLAFSTWGMPVLCKEQIARCLPRLEAVFYCSGTVQYFAKPFLERGIRIFSSWAANAIPVAELTVGEILLANKGAFSAMRMRDKNNYSHRDTYDYCENFAGNYNTCVGIIGAGMIGRKVIELLQPYDITCLVYDPFLTEEAAAALGATKASLEEVFCRCSVVSNHLPNKLETKGMLKKEHFASMRPFAAFINTGRGAQVDTEGMVCVLRNRPDLSALLDVTVPEPLDADSVLFSLDNVYLTPHIAGSMKNEFARMTGFMVQELKRYVNGGKPQYEITGEMLQQLA